MNSKWRWACVLGCAGMAGLATGLAAVDVAPGAVTPEDVAVTEGSPADANPYSIISDRNIFHLNPPPTNPPPPDTTLADLPKVMLTGIMKKHDAWEVFLAVPPKDNKENTVYLTLAPGEKQHDIELVKIRYDKEEVDIINGSIPQTLSVKSNSYASTAAAPPPHAGGAPPGLPGFGHKGGFAPLRNTLPTPSGPSSATTPRGGSAIIAGGGGGSAIISGGAGVASPNAPFAGGAYVSGGNPGYNPTGGAAVPNAAGEQIANALLNQQNRGIVPQPTAPPAPSEPLPVQAAGMMVHEAAGGPPMPPLLPGEK